MIVPEGGFEGRFERAEIAVLLFKGIIGAVPEFYGTGGDLGIFFGCIF